MLRCWPPIRCLFLLTLLVACGGGPGSVGSGSKAAENEPNNDLENANEVALPEAGVVVQGETTLATLDGSVQEDSIDCFRFVAPKSGMIETRLSAAESVRYVSFDVYDGIGTKLHTCSDSSDSPVAYEACTFVKDSTFVVCVTLNTATQYLLQVLPL